MSSKQNYNNGICYHCGADDGLHRSETNQCPLNGREEYREGKKQIWMDTTFEDSGIRKIEDAAIEMFEALKTIRSICANKDHGREGCKYGDTDYDSISAAYGYNLALSYIEEHLGSIQKSELTKTTNND